MKAMPNRFFLRMARRAESRGWAASRLRIARRAGVVPPHGRWAQQLLARVTHRRPGRGAFPEAMIAALVGRAPVYLLQRFTADTWNVTRSAALPAPRQEGFRVPGRVVQIRGAQGAHPVVQNFFPMQFRREVTREPGTAISPMIRMPSALVASLAVRNRREMLSGEASSNLRRKRFRREADSEAAGPLLLSRKRSVVANSPERAEELLFGASSVLGNVAKKHRRVESPAPPAMRAQTAVVAAGRRYFEEEPAVSRGAAAARKPRLGESAVDHGNTIHRAEVPLDATRITDEVLKQLDRRIVAAKERRGRI
jgi:hypothetical protein